MSRIVCVGSVPVKPHRKSPRKPGPFGRGVFPPARPFEPSKSDRIEWATMATVSAKPAPMTFDALMSQIRGDLVRCQELGRRQDDLMAKIRLSKMGIRPVCGSSPENDARAEFNRRLEEVMEGIDDE
jgi:hypothetical protein